MQCPKCSALNSDNAQFCNLCHEPFTKAQVSAEKQDPHPNLEDSSKVKIKPHQTPGFGILIPEPEEPKHVELEQEKQKIAKKKPKKIQTSDKKQPKNKKIIKKSSFDVKTITSWLYPALLSTIVALALSNIIPKEQINAQLPLLKIVLMATLCGLIVSTKGIINLDKKSAATGWLLGLSSSFLAFNLIFFGSIIFMKFNADLYTRFFLGSEILIVSATLSTAIALYLWIEKVEPLPALTIASFILVITSLLTWIILKFTNAPLPIIAFISWPLSLYSLKFLAPKK